MGEGVLHRSRGDAGLIVIASPPVQKEQKIGTIPSLHGRRRAHQSEGVSGCGLSASKYEGIVTLHSGGYVVSGDLVVNGFVLGSGDELAEVEFWRGSPWGFCILGAEFVVGEFDSR